MSDYKVNVIASSKELTKMDKIRMKDTSDTIALDGATQNGAVIFQPIAWVMLEIHNDKAQDGTYVNYIIQAADGTKYRTGSESFWKTFVSLWEDLEDETGWELKCYRLPSKNRPGKDFLTCSLV